MKERPRSRLVKEENGEKKRKTQKKRKRGTWEGEKKKKKKGRRWTTVVANVGDPWTRLWEVVLLKRASTGQPDSVQKLAIDFNKERNPKRLAEIFKKNLAKTVASVIDRAFMRRQFAALLQLDTSD
ncbi:hypothetical protein PTKIN_Ptkin01aG0129800 [Pterospermum kingtungense]